MADLRVTPRCSITATIASLVNSDFIVLLSVSGAVTQLVNNEANHSVVFTLRQSDIFGGSITEVVVRRLPSSLTDCDVAQVWREQFGM